MEKRKIPIITLAIFSITILVMFTFISKPVYAFEITQVSLGGSYTSMQVVGSTMYLLFFGTGAFKVVDLNDGSVDVNTGVSFSNPSFIDFRCNSSSCWVMDSNSATPRFNIYRISGTTGAITQTFTAPDAQHGQAQYAGMAVGDTTVYFTRECATDDQGSSGAGDTDYALFSIDGNNMVGTPVQHTDCGSNFSAIYSSGNVGYLKINTSTDRVALLADGVTQPFRWIDLNVPLTTSNNPVICSAITTQPNIDLSNGNNIQFLSSRVYILLPAGADTYNIDVITSTCSLTNYAGYSSFNTNDANGLGLDSTNDLLYIGGTQADGTGLVLNAYNFTSDTPTTSILTSVFPNNSGNNNAFAFSTTANSGYMVDTASLWIINFGEGVGGETDPNIVNGLNCSLPENEYKLVCRLNSINQTPLTGASQLVNASSTDLACQIGLIACTNGVPDDTNIQTNGIGYILLMVGLGIFVGLLFVASRGQITEIPNFVWMVGTIAIVGAVTVVGWIDPTILIVSIITVIALAGIKAKNIFSGVGGMFKGEEV